MYTTITKYQFVDAFDEMNRGNNFSREGRLALFDYLEQYEESTGDELELNVIALCCEYTEYENLEAFKKEYVEHYETIKDLDHLADFTTVIPIEDTDRFIIADF